MHWNEICELFPNQWLLLEALQAHTEGSERILDRIAVVERFADAAAAWKRYGELHRDDPQRELYPLHTSRERLDIQEIRGPSFRFARCA